MTFQNRRHEHGKWPGRSLGMKLKYQIGANGVKKCVQILCFHHSTEPGGRSAIMLDDENEGDEDDGDDEDVDENDPQLLVGLLRVQQMCCDS